MDDLGQKINEKTARLAVIGLGYVGLPLAVEFAKVGFRVTGIDVDGQKVRALREGKSYIQDVPDQELRTLVEAGNLWAEADYECLQEADAVSICVPTPLSKTKDPDISHILQAAREIAGHLHRGQLIVLESTTYPGTTDEVVLPELSSSGLRVGEDFFLAFSPERVDPGNPLYTTKNTPKIIGGVTPRCTEMAAALYKTALDHVVVVSSTRSAEMVKLLENTFRAVNIGLVNEVALMCDRLGLDVWEVIEAAATKPFGFMPFYPGPGLGGHCIPVDPHYLAWKLKTLDYKARFIELAGEINTGMPFYVAEKVVDALNQAKKSVNGSRILVLGVSYKKNISDVRESPALDIIKILQKKSARICYHDPYVPSLDTGLGVQAVPLTEEVLGEMDCVIIATDHGLFDYFWIVSHSRLIVDTRNATRHIVRGREKIVRL